MDRIRGKGRMPASMPACMTALVAALLAGPCAAAPEAPRSTKGAKAATGPAQLLAAGWKQLDLVNYPASQATFKKVLGSSSATRAQLAEATFGLGHLWQYRRPGASISEATELYQQVAEEYKDTPSAALALMALACLADTPEYEKDRRPDEARRLYREILRDKPESFVVHEAALRLAMTYLEERGSRKTEDEGVRMLTEHLAAHPNNFLATAMHTQLAVLFQSREEFRKALKHYIASDTVDLRAAQSELTDAERKLPLKRRLNQISQRRVMDTGSRAALYYRIASLAERKLKHYAVAVTWYEKIVYEIVRDNKFYVSKLSAERCRKLAAEAGKVVPPHPLAGKERRP